MNQQKNPLISASDMPNLSIVANKVIDLFRDNKLNAEQSANILAAVIASFCRETGWPVSIFKAILDERIKTGQY